MWAGDARLSSVEIRAYPRQRLTAHQRRSARLQGPAPRAFPVDCSYRQNSDSGLGRVDRKNRTVLQSLAVRAQSRNDHGAKSVG